MKIKRAACVPLITHDPFFSVWSPADQLHDTNTVHWSGAPQRLKGFLTVEEWGNMRIMTAAVCQ